jgi:hypothetical protein
LKSRDDVCQELKRSLALLGNPLSDAPIDVVERELRRVELARAPPALTSA